MDNQIKLKEKEEYEMIYKSACPYDCFDCCSVDIHVEGEKVSHVTANNDGPLTGGFLCKKGIAHSERMYREDRLKHPLLKTEKGFEQISWEQAYAIITNKLETARKDFGGTSIGCLSGGGAAGKLKGIHEVFFAHLGAYTDFSGGICWSAGIEATKLDFGAVLGHHPEDMENSNSIVLWGRNPLDTNLHLVPYIKKAKQRGCKVYLIDPIESKSASISDVHIKLRAGSDWAFGVLCVKKCLEKNRIDESFVKNHFYDPTDLLSLIKEIEVDDYREMLDFCGVSEEIIEEFTKRIFETGPSTVYIGFGPQRRRTGGLNVRTINLLWAIMGNIGIAGGGANYANQTNKGKFSFEFAMPKNPPEVREIILGKVGEDLASAEPPVKVLFVISANPASQLPNSVGVRNAFQKVDFKISIEHFMTDTAALCDLILPTTYFTESEDVIFSGMWNSSIKYVSKCVEPLAECKTEFEIFRTLAEHLKIETYPKYSESEFLKLGMKSFEEAGLSFETLKKLGHAESPFQKQVQWDDKNFNHEDGKFHTFSKDQLMDLIHGLSGRLKESNGLIDLVTVHWSDQINSQHSVLLEKQEAPTLNIHHDTAKLHGIVEGDFAMLESQTGILKVKIRITEKAAPETAFMRQGDSDAFGGPLNKLTPSGVTDIGDQALLNEIKISLKKI